MKKRGSSYNYQGRSALGALLTNDRKRAKETREKNETERIKRKLADYDKYEKELKKRGVSKEDAMKNMEWGDRYISPRKITDTRKKAEKLGLYKPKKKKKQTSDNKTSIDPKLYGDMLERKE